jgi:hypothetical protein
MTLGLTKPLTKMNVYQKIFLRDTARQAHKANNLNAIFEPTV